MHHFVDDTNILFSHKSLKKLNRYINHDLSLLVQWLRENIISLNTSKTEIIHFWLKNKKITKNLNFRENGQKISTIKLAKYLGIYLNEHLTWKFQSEQPRSKLSRSRAFILKRRY